MPDDSVQDTPAVARRQTGGRGGSQRPETCRCADDGEGVMAEEYPVQIRRVNDAGRQKSPSPWSIRPGVVFHQYLEIFDAVVQSCRLPSSNAIQFSGRCRGGSVV